MPSKPDPRKVRVKWSGATVNPDLYARVGGQPVRLDPDDIAPPAGTGLIMSRGPTGSRWALDALGADGGIPRMVTPTYGTTAATSFTPYAQAADFYDFAAAINIHPAGTYGGLTNDTQRRLAIDRLQELGIRHARGLGLYTPAYKQDPITVPGAQSWLAECVIQNAARNLGSGGPDGLGEQPIFNIIGWDEREHFTGTNSFNDDRASFWVHGAEATQGQNILRPMTGPPGSVSQTTFQYAGGFYSLDKTTNPADPAIGWSAIAALSGPNEPEIRNGLTYYGDTSEGLTPSADRRTGGYGIRWLARKLKAFRDDPANKNITLLGGADYISFDTGRITPGPAKMPQLVVSPFAHFVTNPGGWQIGGDYTTKARGEFASFHVYWNGGLPEWDEKWGNPQQQSTGFYGWMHNALAVNGAAAGLPRMTTRTLPLFITETGLVTHAGSNNNYGSAVYAPMDVAGEQMIQAALMHYCQGAKRQYWYKLSHEGGDTGSSPPAMGVCDTALGRRAAFYILRNLLANVGWRQGPDEGVQPISIPHTFTPAGNEVGDEVTGGHVNRDGLLKLVLRCSADEMIILLWRWRKIWDRTVYHQRRLAGDSDATAEAAARRTVTPRNTILQIPAGWTADGVCEPSKNQVKDPTDGNTYPNPNNGWSADGSHFAAPGVGGAMAMTVLSGNRVQVPMGGLTRIVRVRR